MTTAHPGSRKLGFLLWMISLSLAASAMIYQRATGPTYELRGSLVIDGEARLDYKLIRSEETIRDATVSIPKLPGVTDATLVWRRYPTDDPFTEVPMVEEQESDATLLSAVLPRQHAAGKLEYWLRVTTAGGERRIPASARAGDADADDENVLIRFKDPVPDAILISHVTFMVLTIILGIRAGLSALLSPYTMRVYTWSALIGMSMGGMMLGPIVQKYAFGAYWTGFPFGYDLTDNKMLIMWMVWIVAASTIGFRARPREGIGRCMVLLAALTMVGVFLIPHSMHGSELDHAKVEQGVNPLEAIGTGDD